MSREPRGDTNDCVVGHPEAVSPPGIATDVSNTTERVFARRGVDIISRQDMVQDPDRLQRQKLYCGVRAGWMNADEASKTTLTSQLIARPPDDAPGAKIPTYTYIPARWRSASALIMDIGQEVRTEDLPL